MGSTYLMTVAEAAAELRVCRRTIYKLFRERRLTPRKIGACTRVSSAELRQYVESLGPAPAATKAVRP